MLSLFISLCTLCLCGFIFREDPDLVKPVLRPVQETFDIGSVGEENQQDYRDREVEEDGMDVLPSGGIHDPENHRESQGTGQGAD